MFRLYFLPLWRFLFMLSFLIIPFYGFSQNQDLFIEEDFLQVPDTIVFVSEEEVDFTEEYLMVHLYAIDKGENFAVPANFKIFNKENNTLLSGAPENKNQYQAALVSNEEYLVEVNANGYLKHSEIINLKVLNGDKELHKVIPLERASYTTKLIAVNALTGQVIRKAEITLVNQSMNKTIHTLVNPETGECRADFDQFSNYKVEVIAQGYLPYHEDFNSYKKFTNKEFKLIPEQKPLIIKLKVLDDLTGKPVNSELKLFAQDKEPIPLKIRKGYTEAPVLSGIMYDILVEANGYESYKSRFALSPEQETDITIKLSSLASDDYEFEVEEDIFADLEVGETVSLNNIIFDQSKFILKETSYEELNKLVNTLEKYPNLQIIIAGHTDNQGNKKLNQLLSLNRAKVIANYLIENGIDAHRLEVVGYGSAHPVAPNDSEENRRKNRRVEFTIK